MVRRLFLKIKFCECSPAYRGWVEIMVIKTLEFLEIKINIPLSVEKVEEKSIISSRKTSMFFDLMNL